METNSVHEYIFYTPMPPYNEDFAVLSGGGAAGKHLHFLV
jgi:hypothetical protein